MSPSGKMTSAAGWPAALNVFGCPCAPGTAYPSQLRPVVEAETAHLPEWWNWLTWGTWNPLVFPNRNRASSSLALGTPKSQ